MLELRLTILRDKPASDRLRKYASAGYYLFQDKATNLYFLTEAVKGQFPRSVFWSGYNRLLNIPCDFDGSYLKAFKADHKDLMVDVLIHDEILRDAIALSDEFSTRVLCVYSNDEGCDFAVTAEDGKLLRLRFDAGRKQGPKIHGDIAREIETEIQATRILLDGEEPSDEGVFEYTGYEAIQTTETPLSLHPYWTYYEGEIQGRVIFKTISSTPENMAPNCLFRNAFLEFEQAFGQTAPDFTNSPEVDRFEIIDFQDPPRVSIFVKLSNFIKSLVALIFSSPKSMLVTAIIVIVLSGAIFGDKTEKTRTQKNFDQDCRAVGGTISGDAEDKCFVDNVLYQNWNLPGEKGERRPLILNIGPQKIACPDVREDRCLVVEGEPFPYKIEGFTFKDGITQTLVVIRTQTCDLNIPGDCPKDGPFFEYKQMLAVEK